VTVPLGAAADLGDVPLRAGLPLTGVLRDENGRAFGRATLVASCPGGLVSARTAADGSFAFRGLPAGTLRIDAMTAPRASFTVDVPRAARAELVVPDAGRLLVWVTGAAGSPVAGRSVWARDADGQIFATDTTGRDGMASLRLVPGRYTVFEESGASAEAEVRTDEHTRLRLASR
jgi:hypothetical protein